MESSKFKVQVSGVQGSKIKVQGEGINSEKSLGRGVTFPALRIL